MSILHSQDGVTVRLGKGAQEDLTKRSSPGLSLESWIGWQEFWELMPCCAVCVMFTNGQGKSSPASILDIQPEFNRKRMLEFCYIGFFFEGSDDKTVVHGF